MRTGFLRRLIAFALTSALLFAQTVTAAHACPVAGLNTASAQMTSDAPECAGITAVTTLPDSEQPGLCISHCAPDHPGMAGSVVVDVSANLLAILPAPALQSGRRDSAALRALKHQPPLGAPLPRILFQVFRN